MSCVRYNDPMSKKMLRLGLVVNDGRILPTVAEYAYEENDKTFSLTPVPKGDRPAKVRISKSKNFMVVDSNYREDSSVVSYFIYCLPEDRKDALYALIVRARKRLADQVARLQKELSALDQFGAGNE